MRPGLLWAKLLSILSRRRDDLELQDEIRGHLDLLADEHRRRGLSPDQAAAAARRAFGGVEQMREIYREQRQLPGVDAWMRDLRRGLAALRRAPAFTVAVVVTLAIGIGANTAIFSIVDGVLLRRAPLDGFERLVMVWQTDRTSGTSREPGSVPDFLDYRERSRSVAPLAGLMAADVSLAPRAGGDVVRVAAMRVSANAWSIFNAAPIIGRTLTEDDDRPSAGRVAAVSEALWRRSFRGDPSVLGATIQVDDQPTVIVGVVPDAADFGFAQLLAAGAYSRGFIDRAEPKVDLWLPLQIEVSAFPRSTHPLFMVGRLVPGAAASTAQQELAILAAELERRYPENAQRGVHVERLTDVVFGPVRPSLLVLLGAVALVLLVACANVANLLLARGLARRREIAVQAALGASTGQIARQFLVEGLLLTLAGSLAGVALAAIGVRALVAIAPATVPRLSQVGLDVRVLAVTLAVSVGIGVVFGLVPTLQARAIDLEATLRSVGNRSSSERLSSRLRSAIVVGEVALSVVLLTGAGLLIRSFSVLQRVDPGFRADGVLKAEFQMPASRYPASFAVFPNFKEMHALTGALIERIAGLGGVESVAIAGNHPLDPGFTNSFVVVGREAESRTWPEVSIRRVTPGYFRTVDVPLVRGRLLAESDTATTASVLLLNEAAARRFFTGQEPIGSRIRLWGASRQVVGIVADERSRGLAEAAPLAAYAPLSQAPSVNGAAVLLVRAVGDPQALAPGVRAIVRDLDASVPVFGVEPLARTVLRSLAERRFAMLLLGLFAGTALVLAALGVHSLFQYQVEQRTREMGIRMALGAQPRETLALLLAQGARLTIAGVSVGIAGAVVLTRLLTSLLFGITPTDPVAFGGVAVLMSGVAVLATFLSARGVMRVEPLSALRAD